MEGMCMYVQGGWMVVGAREIGRKEKGRGHQLSPFSLSSSSYSL